MNVNKVDNSTKFGATLTGDSHNIVRNSVVKGGLSPKLAIFLVKRIHTYFPSKDYFIHMNEYVADRDAGKVLCGVTIEKKSPTDMDPRKSLYKTMHFVKPERHYEEWGWEENTLFKFVQAVKELSKKDWSFEHNIKNGTKTESFMM